MIHILCIVRTYIASTVYNAFRVTAQLERIVLSLSKPLTRMFTICSLQEFCCTTYNTKPRMSICCFRSFIVHSLIQEEAAIRSRFRVVVFRNSILLSSPAAMSLYPQPQLSIRIMLFWGATRCKSLVLPFPLVLNVPVVLDECTATQNNAWSSIVPFSV